MENQVPEGQESSVAADEPAFFSVISARDPVWANAEHTAISLYVLFYGFKDTLGEMSFGASSTDVEAHGREIFARAKDGEFGEVAPYVVSASEINARLSVLTAEATDKINALQIEVNTLQDAVDLEMATDEEIARLAAAKTELTAWKRYRVYLSRVPSQPGFPADVTWPEKPA